MIFSGDQNGGRVLCGIADQRDENDPHENPRHPKAGGGRFERADQNLAHHAGSNRREGEDDDGRAFGPHVIRLIGTLRLISDVQMPVCLERKNEAQHVDPEQDHGNIEAELRFRR